MEKLLELITEMENPLIASGTVPEKIVQPLSEEGGACESAVLGVSRAVRDLLGEYGPEARIALAREEGISRSLRK